MNWNRLAPSSLLGLPLLALVASLSFGSNAHAAPVSPSLSAALTFSERSRAKAILLSGVDAGQTDLDHRVFLPTIGKQSAQLELEVFDWAGNLQSWDWLVEHYGAVWLQEGSGAASVSVLREDLSGNTVLIATVERNHQPVQDVPVMFYWPDAPWLPSELKACGLDQALVIYTNASGEAHFSMGGGSAYWPPAGGPHVVWVGGSGSDCLGGLGWLGQTQYYHVNSEWILP